MKHDLELYPFVKQKPRKTLITPIIEKRIAEKSVGSAMASSKALVCNDCVPPKAAAAPSIQVLATLLKGSCWVKLQPDVWQWVRSANDFSSFGLNCFRSFAQSILPALILAISIKWFIPIAQKKDRRGANSSIFIPVANPVRMYSIPSASV